MLAIRFNGWVNSSEDAQVCRERDDRNPVFKLWRDGYLIVGDDDGSKHGTYLCRVIIDGPMEEEWIQKPFSIEEMESIINNK